MKIKNEHSGWIMWAVSLRKIFTNYSYDEGIMHIDFSILLFMLFLFPNSIRYFTVELFLSID